MGTDFWLRQWQAFTQAPVACLFFVALGAVAAWWLRKSVDQGKAEGLEAQNQGLREQINAWEQRLKLASEQEQAAIKARQAAEKNLATLDAQIKRRAPIAEMDTTITAAKMYTADIGRAQDRVLHTLSRDDTITFPGGREGRILWSARKPSGSEEDH
jgi:hypothetical protein